MFPVRVQWLPLRDVAVILSMSDEALRKKLERHARKAPDGVVEAELDGIRGRKFGRSWRVLLSERWLGELGKRPA